MSVVRPTSSWSPQALRPKPAGLVRFRITNRDMRLHLAGVVRLQRGKEVGFVICVETSEDVSKDDISLGSSSKRPMDIFRIQPRKGFIVSRQQSSQSVHNRRLADIIGPNHYIQARLKLQLRFEQFSEINDFHLRQIHECPLDFINS